MKVSNCSNCTTEKGVAFGKYSVVKAKTGYFGKDCIIGDNVEIRSQDIHIGENTRIDDNTTITAYEKLRIGNNSIIRKNARFKARSIEIGDFFYSNDNPIPLIIGGGGSDGPEARIRIGSRCVMHDSFINVCMPVEIGDNVGLSPGSSIITHGFWNSVLEGYGSEFASVQIGNNVLVGYRAIILPGVTLGDYCVVGAGSVVTKSFPSNCVVGGVPARIIRSEPDYPKRPSFEEKVNTMEKLLREYAEHLRDKVDNTVFAKSDDISTITGEYDGDVFHVTFSPFYDESLWRKYKERTILITLGKALFTPDNGFSINLSDYTWSGAEDEISDDLRDFLRHYGIRIFSRHFRSIPSKLKRDLDSLGPV